MDSNTEGLPVVAASNDGEETPCGRAWVSAAELWPDETKAERREAQQALHEGVSEYIAYHGTSAMLEEVLFLILERAHYAGDRCDGFDKAWNELREIAARLREFD